MTTTNDKTVETLFESFLNSDPTGELAEEMHRISAIIDEQIAAGAVDPDTIGDYEYAASKYGFYAGFFMGLNLVAAKTRLALNRQRGLLEEPEED